MTTGVQGTFVIPWSQTEIDGAPALAETVPQLGVTWRWQGTAQRVDGPGDVAKLARAESVVALHLRAAGAARRLIEGIPEIGTLAAQPDTGDDPVLESAFSVSDGTSLWNALVVEPETGPKLLVFVDALPPLGQDLWVVRVTEAERARRVQQAGALAGGVICFAAGAMIATPEGPRLVESLGPGDQVLTQDNGPQPIIWAGARRMSGARLFAMPHLRPLRLRAGALGPDVPDGDLLVSPSHRLLITGPAARNLFGTPEVLVKARDLAGVPGIATDLHVREVTYVHLMLDHHQILFANGVASDSFHPAEADIATLAPADRARLLETLPDIAGYGPMARRALTAGEAAILRHDARMGG